MEEPLERALSFCSALELMGLGLNRIDSDHGSAVLAQAETMKVDLLKVQSMWRQLLADNALHLPIRPPRRR